MSEKLPKEPQNEEVDLGQLFNAIGNMFERLFLFIGKLFKSLFTIIIYALKPLVQNFKWVAIIIMISAVIGFVIEKIKEPVFESNMLVKPYFESKYKLSENIDYLNSLISTKNIAELASVFDIDSTRAKELINFELETGPQSQNELIQEYDEYIKSIDSTVANEVTYEEFAENRNILSSTIFSINAKSKSNDIFLDLEGGFVKIFENEYSKKLKERTERIWNVERANYIRELERIDSLQKVYLDIRIRESQEDRSSVSVTGLLPLTKEKSETKEYELFQEELEIRNSLRLLEEKIIEENEYFDIISGFDAIGSRDSDFYNNYLLFLPAIVFLVLILSFVVFKVFIFIKEYE